MSKKPARRKIPEIPLVGDVDDWEEDLLKSLLDMKPGAECTLYFDSSGGSVYGAVAITTLLRQRQIQATGIVVGECSSAALLIFSACVKRLVTQYSTFFFHRMRWQSEKRCGAHEASRWARHFEDMERDIDALQEKLFGTGVEQLRLWTAGSHYVTGREMVEAGLAQMLEI